MRQTRIAGLVEQLPNPNFRVTLSDKMDALGIRRPQLVNCPITGYTATSGPPGATASSTSPAQRSLVVPNLVNGQTYTFTASATNGSGTGAASAASNSIQAEPTTK